MKKIWIVSLLLLGSFAHGWLPLKGRIAVRRPAARHAWLSYAEYDKAFSGDLRTAQTDLEGRYMLPDDDKISRLRPPRTGVVPEVISTASLDEAMEAARRAARPGDAVLLSPACASFDLFRNYEQRGELFKKWVGEHC